MQEPNTCNSCGGPPEEKGYQFPLCAACRDQFSNRPLPIWLTAVFVLGVAVVLFALTRFPASLEAGIAFERGHRAEAAGRYAVAAAHYRRVAQRFPEATAVIVRLGVSEYRAGNLRQAVMALDRLSSKPGDEDTVREVNQVMDEIEQRMAGTDHRRR
jgi:hypothetical protein